MWCATLREKTIQVRYDRNRRNRFIVFFGGKRMGDANLLNLHSNAQQVRKSLQKKGGGV